MNVFWGWKGLGLGIKFGVGFSRWNNIEMSVNAAQAEDMINKNQGNAKFVIVDVRS